MGKRKKPADDAAKRKILEIIKEDEQARKRVLQVVAGSDKPPSKRIVDYALVSGELGDSDETHVTGMLSDYASDVIRGLGEKERAVARLYETFPDGKIPITIELPRARRNPIHQAKKGISMRSALRSRYESKDLPEEEVERIVHSHAMRLYSHIDEIDSLQKVQRGTRTICTVSDVERFYELCDWFDANPRKTWNHVPENLYMR